ncbi:TPA: hypothetical protein N3552_001906 [Klebsiella variicola]|nr:hypothetical protein [Klebsiella quasipneumoniae subsp. quasipneumoniae]HCI4651134.1 hypothetical protein [Klebsiella quasipneumoniae subsp. quasipneumoniae]HCM8069536.1 hypothetical protein [Klebsiella variicola]
MDEFPSLMITFNEFEELREPLLRQGWIVMSDGRIRYASRFAAVLVSMSQYGNQWKDNLLQRGTPALVQTIDAVIALAGLANSVRDESHRIGVAHAIHNSMTHHFSFYRLLHAEKVGYGLAVQSVLQYTSPLTGSLYSAGSGKWIHR